MNKKSIITVLREFFGQRPGQTTLEFARELKELGDGEKLWLAQQAASAMGLSADSLAFAAA